MAKKTVEDREIKTGLAKKIIQSSGNKYGNTINKSEVLNNIDSFKTNIPIINVALSAEVDKGMETGVLQIVGQSRTFKTMFMLLLASEYMIEHPESIFVLFDSERGASLKYFKNFNIDQDRVVHLPIETVEDLIIQYNRIKKNLTRGDKVFFGVDSIGLLPSVKEIIDAETGESKADFTRTKALNSFWRTVSTSLPILNVPMVVINHSYVVIGGYKGQRQIKGGENGILVANDIWMIGREQDKDGNDLNGFDFIINIEKSRKVQEKSKFPVSVSFENGIYKYSGILELALESGHVVRSGAWYEIPNGDKKYRSTELDAYFKDLCECDDFKEFVKQKYILKETQMVKVEEDV